MPGQRRGFIKDRFFAAPPYAPAFVHGDRTEIAFAVAAAMGLQGKADGIERLQLPLSAVGRVRIARERKFRDRIELRLGFIRRRGMLVITSYSIHYTKLYELGIWLHRRIEERLFYQTVYLMLAGVGLKLLYDGLAGGLR